MQMSTLLRWFDRIVIAAAIAGIGVLIEGRINPVAAGVFVGMAVGAIVLMRGGIRR